MEYVTSTGASVRFFKADNDLGAERPCSTKASIASENKSASVCWHVQTGFKLVGLDSDVQPIAPISLFCTLFMMPKSRDFISSLFSFKRTTKNNWVSRIKKIIKNSPTHTF